MNVLIIDRKYNNYSIDLKLASANTFLLFSFLSVSTFNGV